MDIFIILLFVLFCTRFSTSKCPTEEMIGLQTLTFLVHHDQLAAEIRSRTHRTRLFSSLASGQLELSVLGDPAHSLFGECFSTSAIPSKALHLACAVPPARTGSRHCVHSRMAYFSGAVWEDPQLSTSAGHQQNSSQLVTRRMRSLMSNTCPLVSGLPFVLICWV